MRREGGHLRGGDAPPPTHTRTAETVAALPAKLREDLPLPSPTRQPMLSLLETLNTVGPQFAATTLRHVGACMRSDAGDYIV